MTWGAYTIAAPGGSSSSFLRNDGTWVTPAGGGTVTGPSTSTIGYVPTWSGTGGTTLAAGLAAPTSGVLIASTVAPTANPITGTPSSTTFLRGDGTWATPTGGGNVSGPGSSTSGYVPTWSGTTGTVLNTGLAAPTSGTLISSSTALAGAVTGTPSSSNFLCGNGTWAVASPFINIMSFGAVGNGTTDDHVAFQNALNSFGTKGGTLYLPSGYSYYVNATLTVPNNVTIQGPYSFVGSPSTQSSPQNYAAMSAIILATTHTISLGYSAGIQGCLIYPYGMTFPQTSSSSWTGTAVTIAGDDTFILNSMIIGFNQGVISNGYDRHHIQYLYHDNNGIAIQNSQDITHIFGCHAWPFATVSYGGTYTTLTRTGTAYYLYNTADNAKITNCFAYGYLIGFCLNSVNACTLLNCSADNAYSAGPLYSGTYGFQVIGTSVDTRLVGCQSVAMYYCAVYINVTASNFVTISELNVLEGAPGGPGDGVYVVSGDCSIHNSQFRAVESAVVTTSATSRIFVDDCRLSLIYSIPFHATVTTSLFFIGANNDYGDYTSIIADTTIVPQAVVSASGINLPNSGSIFNITGTTGISAIQSSPMRTVTLVFQGSLTFTSSTGAYYSVLLIGGTRAVSAGSTMTLVHNGTQWYEC
jgi:hypothetical protein